MQVAKAWAEAGDAFTKAVELHVKLGSTYDAANAAQEAATAFKNVSTARSVRLPALMDEMRSPACFGLPCSLVGVGTASEGILPSHLRAAG